MPDPIPSGATPTYIGKDENDIGHSKADGSSLSCRIHVDAGDRPFQRSASCAAVVGNAIRLVLSFGGTGVAARLLAYVDPLTGKAVIRMGMFDISDNNRGHEIGDQIVWDSDEPIIEAGK